MRSGSGVETVQTSKAATTDSACLAAITIVSAIPYVARLGFYSDDWAILAGFSASTHNSFADLLSGFGGRPVQAVYSAALFALFGLDPLGYHLVDTAVLACAAVLLYLLLLRLSFSRSESFATTLLFVMLPQLSTVRVWFAAGQVPLSMALMLLSMHGQLSFAASRSFGWLAVAIAAAVLSIGAYEIFGPLIGAFALALVFVRWRKSKVRRDWRALAAAAAVLATLILAFVYKFLSSGRAGHVGDLKRYLNGLHQLFRVDYDWRVDSGLNVVATPKTHFWAPIEGWWTGAKLLLSGKADVEVSAIALLIAGLAIWRLASAREARSASSRLLLLGGAAFLLGNAIFLIVPAVVFTSTGIDNRVHVAAAIGVAMIFAALIELAIRAVPVPYRALTFSTLLAAISATAFARLAAIERYWTEAPALQHRVLNAARVDLRHLPPNSTVILDGVCPYHGPAVVFETNWDVAGALTLALGYPVDGDAVSPRMTVTPTGLETSIYKAPTFYPYGATLYVYDPAKHRLVRLENAAAAVRYFHNRGERTCPGYVARGVEV